MKALQLTDAESNLVLELLKAELKEIQHEIHHTDALAMRNQLHARSHVIGRLTERLSEAEPALILNRSATEAPAGR